MAVTIDGVGEINGVVLPTTGFGKVLQVVRATDGTQRTTTSTTFVNASISVTITPQKSDSVILVIWTGVAQTSAGNVYTALNISDAAYNPLSGAENVIIYDTNTQNIRVPFTLIGYDTPATTSAETYLGRFLSSSGTATLMNNQATGQLFAIEVSA